MRDCAEDLISSFNNLKQEETNYEEFFENFYVERTHSYRAKELVSLFEMQKNTRTTLFSGQPGCGKTTELQSVKKLLKLSTKKNFTVIFISPFSDGIFGRNLEYTDILIGIFSEVLNQIPHDMKLPKKIVIELSKLLKELDDDKEITISEKNDDSITSGFISLFSIKYGKSDEIRKRFQMKTESNIRRILSLFDSVLHEIRQNNKDTDRIVVIVDNLEKIVRDETIIEFLRYHGNLILGRDCDFIISINNNIRFYTQGENALLKFQEFFCLPFIAIRNKDNSYDYDEINNIKEMIYKRVSKDLIDEKALELAIIYSGGNLSTLFRIYGTAINKVNFKEKCKITFEFVEDAFYDVRYRDSYLNTTQLETLRKIHKSKKDYRIELSPNELKNHLNNCALLTYRDIKNHNLEWYVLNPAFFFEEELKEIEKKYEE